MKRVVIAPVIRSEKDELYTLQTVFRFLSSGATVCMAENHNGHAYASGAQFFSEDKLYDDCELIVALGGDGTILRAAENALKYNVPLLGVNLGRLGYMAELEKDELHLIDKIFKGEYTLEDRMVLSVYIHRENGNHETLREALNDVVISRGGYTRSIDMDLYADSKSVRTIRADGLIIATPTGSTAYSMAAGGSVIDPTIECICATPICPISRYACPTVFSGNSVLEIVNGDERAENWSITIDGESVTPLSFGEKLVIKRSAKTVKMLLLKDEGFFETLNNKISKYELKK